MRNQRQTKQKQIILGALPSLDHPTATEVYERIHVENPSVSRATVFRVLRQAEENGSVRRLSFSDGEDRFDYNMIPHYHVRCIFCGRVSDVKMSVFDAPEDKVEDSYGFTLLSHDLEFKGICPDCRRDRERK